MGNAVASERMNTCTAFDIVECLGEELDITANATTTKWKAYLARWAYEVLQQSPKNYLYQKDGQEYVKVFDNHRIPFILHMRIAAIDDDLVAGECCGCRRAIDE